jgi:hypothetical protein
MQTDQIGQLLEQLGQALGAVHVDIQIAHREIQVLRIGQPAPAGTAKLSLAVWVRVMIGGPFFPTAPS